MTALSDATLGQVAVNVEDVARATRFYRDVLGLTFLFEAPGMAFFSAGATRLMLSAPEGEFAGRSSILYFKVGDIASAVETIETAGGQFRSAPAIAHRAPDHELWLASFSDGEGNVHALMEERATTG